MPCVNVDDDFVGTITFDGNQFTYKNSIKLCLERKAKIAKNNSQQRIAINYNSNVPSSLINPKPDNFSSGFLTFLIE